MCVYSGRSYLVHLFDLFCLDKKEIEKESECSN